MAPIHSWAAGERYTFSMSMRVEADAGLSALSTYYFHDNHYLGTGNSPVVGEWGTSVVVFGINESVLPNAMEMGAAANIDDGGGGCFLVDDAVLKRIVDASAD